MPPAAVLIDSSLAAGISIFARGDSWLLRRRDGVFIAIRGAHADDIGVVDQIGSHAGLSPEFARAGFLNERREGPTPPQPQITGQGVLHDAVGPLIERATVRSGSPSPLCCQLLDDPPDEATAPTPGIVVWPEGAQVFVSPVIVSQDPWPVAIADVLHRRVAASPVPDLLCGYFAAHRRAPVTIQPAAALLVAALAVDQLADGYRARRRLRTIDVDQSTWVDRAILPIPAAERRGW